ncbi:MAG: hypothetical protein AAF696_34850 [Bacteroidota bacterium]
MKKYFLLLLFLLPLGLLAQSPAGLLDLRIGFGPTAFGSGEMKGFMIENELTYTINAAYSASFSLGVGYSDDGIDYSSSFLQSNLHAFYAPFGNDKRYIFRLGAGMTYLRYREIVQISPASMDAVLLEPEYEFRNKLSPGMSILIDNTYHINDKLLASTTLRMQHYTTDISGSILVKIGIKI